MAPILKYSLYNVLRAKWLILYGIFFGVFTGALLQFGGESDKTAATLLNLILFIVPMVSILYACIYWYNAEAFTHLLLTQPLRRNHVFLATWLAIGAGLAGSFLISTLIPLLAYSSFDAKSAALIGVGVLLTFIFVAIGMLVSTLIADRMKGIGLTFLVWLYFAILHDALVFAVVSGLREYPIEGPAMVLMASNPIDLARVSLLLAIDLPAMMGYTGKILQATLSGPSGLILSMGVLILWVVLPMMASLRVFSRKDL